MQEELWANKTKRREKTNPAPQANPLFLDRKVGAWCPPKIRGQSCQQLITEMLSAKAAFTKTCASTVPRASFFGLEHIFFEVAKSLVGKDRRMSLEKGTQAGGPVQTQSGLSLKLENAVTGWIRNAKPRCRVVMKFTPKKILISHPDICCLGEMLEEADAGDLRKLQTLMVRCWEHLETLKKYFQILREEGVSTLLIADENAPGTVKKVLVVKPEAVETHVEVAVMCEMVCFLKNSTAKKVGAERFRSLSWFDLSLLPELLHCQEQMASFSLLKDHSRETLGRTVALAISSSQPDHNHNWFRGLLGRLKLATRKDLGEMARIVRTKTTEHRKFVCGREGTLSSHCLSTKC
ncbi:LOW QUALITY PROTEIN: testis-expressed protein 15 [Ciconia maguari]